MMTYRPAKPASGTTVGLRQKIAIGFPPGMFDRISKAAKENGRSFSEQVVKLCEYALRVKPDARAAWQPIETAPRDGSFVLIFSPVALEPLLYIASFNEFEEDLDPGEWTDPSLYLVPDPTHWMPLPEPPR